MQQVQVQYLLQAAVLAAVTKQAQVTYQVVTVRQAAAVLMAMQATQAALLQSAA